MRTIGVIQARMSSDRLERKILADIDGFPALRRIFQRMSAAEELDYVVAAFPAEDATDGQLKDVLREYSIPAHFPDLAPENVIGRISRVAVEEGAEMVVVVGGDCPLVCHQHLDSLAWNFKVVRKQKKIDMMSNVLERRYPDGTDIEAYTTPLLRNIEASLSDATEREYFAFWARGNKAVKKEMHVDLGWEDEDADLLGSRWTLDYPEDLEFIRQIYRRVGGTSVFTGDQVFNVLRADPSLLDINRMRRDPSFGAPPA